MRYAFALSILVVLAADYALTTLLGDWRVAVAAGFIGGLFLLSRLKSFISGFLGVLIAWVLMMAPILLNANNQKLLAILANIIGMPPYLPLSLLFVLPAVLGGLSSLLATLMRLIIKRT